MSIVVNEEYLLSKCLNGNKLWQNYKNGLHKIECHHFIQGIASVTDSCCVLATEEQLRQLVLNYTHKNNFGVMHLAPAFNLGEFL